MFVTFMVGIEVIFDIIEFDTSIFIYELSVNRCVLPVNRVVVNVVIDPVLNPIFFDISTFI